LPGNKRRAVLFSSVLRTSKYTTTHTPCVCIMRRSTSFCFFFVRSELQSVLCESVESINQSNESIRFKINNNNLFSCPVRRFSDRSGRLKHHFGAKIAELFTSNAKKSINEYNCLGSRVPTTFNLLSSCCRSSE
jgi:hypothetical protein